MPKRSAGILAWKRDNGVVRVLLVHPGGPFWKNMDAGAWTIPKGEIAPGEEPLDAARREFKEETGHELAGEFVPLSEVRQTGGKIVMAWAIEAEIDADAVASNRFEMEWPPRSGRKQSFPEIDRAGWFPLDEARARINRGQAPLLAELEKMAGSRDPSRADDRLA